MKLFSTENAKNILEEISRKKLFKRYIILLISLLVSAIMFNVLQLPTQIVSGGSGGVAIITEYLFSWEPSLVIFVISSTLLIISFLTLGIEKTSGAIVATFVYPMFVSLTRDWGYYFRFDTTDMILVSILIGVIGGITTGINYKIGFNSGGLGILNQILFHWKKWSISKTSLIMNALIVLVGGFYFGWTMVMYACIVIFINSLVMDKVLLGISRSKALYIITTEEDEIKDYIMNKLHHGVTIFNVKGGFLEKRKHVLMTVIPTSDYFKLTEGVKVIEPKAFFVVVDAYQSSVATDFIPTVK